MFNSPNTAAMMGVVPANRRGIAAGARTLLQNTGRRAVDRVRARDRDLLDPESDAVRGLLRPRQGPLRREARTRSSPTCTRRCGCWRRPRCSGAFVCLLRPVPRHRERQPALAADALGRGSRVPVRDALARPDSRNQRRRRARPAASSLRIGDVAELVGTTPRTIRYYEELGLLPQAPARAVRRPPRSTSPRRSSGCAR